jgi:hypothetical protein
MMRFVLFNKRRELFSLHEHLASVPVTNLIITGTEARCS